MQEKREIFGSLNGKLPKQVFGDLPTPCYVIDESALVHNGEILKGVQDRTGAKILLAQKAFSNYDFYPMLSKYLAGTEASGLYEARLGREEMTDKEVHTFCGAYKQEDIEEILEHSDHIVFNSINQLARWGCLAKRRGRSVGLRINPQFSTQDGHAIYDPCAPGSRLGVSREEWDKQMSDDIIRNLDGLHFHTLCEQNSDDLDSTLRAVEEKWGDILPMMKWLNMGGGHHITRHDYDIDLLEKNINYAMDKWGVEVYLEPGEAVALNAGYFVTKVLDIVENSGIKVAILDGSAACHMPDVIEMPYMPPLYGANVESGEYRYRLGGPTCLAGDVIGDYYFDEPLQVGDMLCFGDMAIYTTCKNNTFNGMPLPNIWKKTMEGQLERLTDFSYADFKMRLGKQKA